MQQKVMLQLHRLVVFLSGVFIASFIQSGHERLKIDVMWSTRFFALSVACGLAALLLWHGLAYAYSRLRKMSPECILQADAYSYIAFFPVLSYHPYLERDLKPWTFFIFICAFFLFLKLILLVLADKGRLPSFLQFSFHQKLKRRFPVYVIIILTALFYYQRSLAAYTADIQQNLSLRLGLEGRKCHLLPWGTSREYTLRQSRNGTLCLAYGFTDEMLAARGVVHPKQLKVDIRERKSGKKESFSFPIDFEAGWHQIRIDLDKTPMADSEDDLTVKVSTTKTASWLWTDATAKSIAVSDAFIADKRRDGQANVVLISVDALRADHIHAFGYEKDITPALDRLIDESFSFSHMISAGTWTIPSNIAMLTSVYPEETILDIERERLANPTFVEEFRKHDYVTIAVSDGGWISSETAFMNGFDIFVETRCIFDECKGQINFDLARKILDDWRGYPVFLWVYTNEVHNTTWHPTPAWGPCPTDQGKLVKAYDRALESFDSSLDGFIGYLRSNRMLDDTLLLLTADHGNAFGENHDNPAYVPCGHGDLPYTEQNLIPLVVKPPKAFGFPHGRIFTATVSNIDIAPTMLEILGMKGPQSFKGISLLPIVFGEAPPADREIFSSQSLWGADSTSLVKNSMKIIYPRSKTKGTIKIYDLSRDPKEKVDLSGNTALREKMAADVERHLTKATREIEQIEAGKPVTLSDDLSEQIKALGYVR